VNARDAIPQTGKFLLDLSYFTLNDDETPPCPEMQAKAWIKLTAKDTGTGIPPDTLPHIFEPFFTTKAVGKGTGLGLAQVYGIVQQHEGCITVDSQLGVGTTFTIYLPALRQAAGAAHDEVEASLPLGDGETILLVEDNRDLLEAFEATLEQLNYHVISTWNGTDALQTYHEKQDQIDLILTDIVMPQMNGIELTKQLHQRYQEVPPIVLMTGFSDEANLSSELERLIFASLKKPLNISELADKLWEVLHHRHSAG